MGYGNGFFTKIRFHRKAGTLIKKNSTNWTKIELLYQEFCISFLNFFTYYKAIFLTKMFLLIYKIYERREFMPDKISINTNGLPNHNKIDGKIDDFVQGNTGDCWFLAAVESLSASKEGKDCIKNTIKTNKDGSYSVFFQGDSSKTEYKFTQKELENANEFSYGDGDTRLLEMAMKKYMESKNEPFEYNGSGQKAYNTLMNEKHKTESISIIGNKKMAIDRKGNIIQNNYNSSPFQKMQNIPKTAEEEIDKILKEKSNNSSIPVTVGTNYNPKDSKLLNNHAYMVKNVNYKNKTMTLIDPHCTVYELTISMDYFDKNFMNISMAEVFSKEDSPQSKPSLLESAKISQPMFI